MSRQGLESNENTVDFSTFVAPKECRGCGGIQRMFHLHGVGGTFIRDCYPAQKALGYQQIDGEESSQAELAIQGLIQQAGTIYKCDFSPGKPIAKFVKK